MYIFYNRLMEKQNKIKSSSSKSNKNLENKSKGNKTTAKSKTAIKSKADNKKIPAEKKSVISKTKKVVKKNETEKVTDKKKLDNNKLKAEKNNKEKKVKKEHKKLTKKQIILISSISAAIAAVILTIVLCVVLIKPKSPEITLSKIEVLRYPIKTSGYKAFDEFDDDGLVLKATYSDESTRDIYEGWQVLYISSDDSVHADGFYAGETKVNILYHEKTCEIAVDEVSKTQRDVQISLQRYSQIKTEGEVNLPTDNVTIKNSAGETITGIDYTLVYCRQFESLQNYQKTTIDDGSLASGGAPKNVGFYKVFAVISGGQNYFDIQSSAVEFSIIDEQSLELYAASGETKFGFKEQVVPAPINPTYIEFELSETNGIKTINYYSNFAGNGKAYVYEKDIELISSDNEKTQISFKNDEISLQNAQNPLKKWLRPAYLGTFERTVTPEFILSEYGLVLSENKTLSLNVFLDDTKKDGIVYFKFNLLWKNGEQPEMKEIDGTVVYSKNQNGTGNLSFNIANEQLITKLFGIDNIEESNNMSVIEIEINNISEAVISSGEYTKI